MSPPQITKYGEEEIGQKYDNCITDFLVKTGAGIAIGGVFSLLVMKRKAWPLAFATGVGFGMSIANCQNEFRSIYPTKVYTLSANNKIYPSETEINSTS